MEQRKFNIYTFLSSFAKGLIETFIPLILYKYGYSLKEVLFYYLICNLSSLIIMFPCLKLIKKHNRLLAFSSIFFITIVQIMLNNIVYSYLYLISLGIMYALYRRCYWISRRYYNLNNIKEKNICKSYTLICILSELAAMTSTYIGSLLLDFTDIKILAIISILFFIISMIPLFSLNYNQDENRKMHLFKTMKKISFGNLIHFGCFELKAITKFLFPLYLFIYVQDRYQVVGLLSLIADFATILFSYMYGKKLNEGKNHLRLSIVLFIIILVFKANTTSYILAIIAFLEGIISKANEISLSKEFYTLSKKYDYYNYSTAYEFTQNVFRSVTLLILYLFVNDIKIMVYITLLIMSFSLLYKFKQEVE